MRTSIVIASWDRRDLLRCCLESLRAQLLAPFEVIVVDNGSSDGTCEMVRSEFPDMRLLVLPENRGYCGGNNAGLALVRGELVVLLNNDVVASPEWLRELVAPFEDPQVGFAASKVVFAEHPDILDSAGDGLSITGSAFRRGHLQPAANFSTAGPVFAASGSAAIYRRSMLDDIGLLDQDFFAVYEDVDLSFRARLAGYQGVYCPDAVVLHQAWGTIGYLSPSYVYYGHRNTEFVFWQNMPAPLLWFCLIPHLAYELAGLFYFTRRGRGRAFLRAKYDAARSWRKIRAKRQALQHTRRVPARAIVQWLDISLVNLVWRALAKFSPPPFHPRTGGRPQEA